MQPTLTLLVWIGASSLLHTSLVPLISVAVLMGCAARYPCRYPVRLSHHASHLLLYDADVRRFPVRIELSRDHVPIGQDEGLMWFDGPLMRFEGAGCGFALTSGQVSEIRRTEDRVRIVCLKHGNGDSTIRVELFTRVGAWKSPDVDDEFSSEAADWGLRKAEGATVLPPIDPHPNASHERGRAYVEGGLIGLLGTVGALALMLAPHNAIPSWIPFVLAALIGAVAVTLVRMKIERAASISAVLARGLRAGHPSAVPMVTSEAERQRNPR